jgi:hypothetical protein
MGLPRGAIVSVSLNEVEATAKKATRGAGYSWGIAEEAAKATRWLCAHGFDGCASLSALLRKTDRAVLAEMAPTALTQEWCASSGALCSIMAGAALSDCAMRLKQTDIQMVSVVEPLLVLPFAAAAARQLGVTITVAWDGQSATTDGAEISLSDAAGMAAAKARLTIRIGGTLGRTTPHYTRTAPDAAVWDKLHQLAGRTYAPATEESRLLGAGVGVSDNE